MNKNAIKKFAIDARNKLIASVTDKAGMLGITPDNCSEAITKGADFEVYKTAAGTEVTLNKKQCELRGKLVDQIHARGFEAVVEEVAYTWFNRICAIRFMEVNDYMYPVRVRVLSSEKEGKNEPDVVTMAPDIDWNFTDKEREEIIDAKMNNRLDDLFRMLFMKQCNLLHEVLPGLFEETEDYTEMLLNISFTNEDDVIRMLVDGIDEKDFNITSVDEDGKVAGQVEIIGWLYQYYNTEPKNKAFAKKTKITKEEVPAVTQLFTPDWIVRYMVENSLGRMWVEGHPDDELKNKWKYYLDEAEQEESVQLELNKIKAEYATLKPEDIKLIDPCMGSGHILVYAFDVFMQIYENAGWSQRDAAQSIIQNNIYGLDIDDRAAQLSYFAVLMKARQYDRRILTRGIEPNVYAVQESNGINRGQLKYFGTGLTDTEKNVAVSQMEGLLNTLNDAKEYGSLLNVEDYDWGLLEKFVENTDTESQISFDTYGLDETAEQLKRLIRIGKVMAQKYEIVATNPPYAGTSNLSSTRRKWYGNNEYVINWSNNGEELKNYKDENEIKLSYPRNLDYQMKEALTWGDICTGDFSMRYSPSGFFFSDVGNELFVPNELLMYALAFCNTNVFNTISKMINQTMHFKPGNMLSVPFIVDRNNKKIVENTAKININLAKKDWDSFENSWDFKRHPLISIISHNRAFIDDTTDIDLSECYTCWEDECNERFNQLKENEEELNRIFIDIYGLQDELTPEVDYKDVTVRKADLQRDIKSLVSYAVGCMFGRYSLDEEGLVLAGQPFESHFFEASAPVCGTGFAGAPEASVPIGEFYYKTDDGVKKCTYNPDKDNIIPICDEEYFSDDIVSRFCEWVKLVYGEKSLETNLDFIAKALGNKGNTSREVIRNYFLNDFFKDHCNTYSVTGSGKRPMQEEISLLVRMRYLTLVLRR